MVPSAHGSTQMVLLPSNEPSAVLQLVSLPPEEPDEGNQMTKTIWGQGWGKENPARKTRAGFEIVRPVRLEPVSYTHLTLPTICSV